VRNVRAAKHERWVSVSARVVKNIVAVRHGGEAVLRGVYPEMAWRGTQRQEGSWCWGGEARWGFRTKLGGQRRLRERRLCRGTHVRG